MRGTQRREAILAEVDAPDAALGFIMWNKLYPMTDPPNYKADRRRIGRGSRRSHL